MSRQARRSRHPSPAAWSLCVLVTCTTAGAQTALHETGAKPGDDFYTYANNAWLTATWIPPGQNRWGARNDIQENTTHRVADLVAGAGDMPPGSYQRKVSDFYAAYVNGGLIEKTGLKAISPDFERIERVRDKTQLAALLGSDLRADVDPLNFGIYESSGLFGLSVENGIHGERNHFAYLIQGGLGLRERDRYLDPSPAAQAARDSYKAYIAHVLKSAGFERPDQRAEAVLALETSLARCHLTTEQSSSERNADNRWSREEFVRNAPGMDWPAFFSAARLPDHANLVAWQPDAMKGTAMLVASEPLEVWKDYLRFHAIDRYADVLPPDIAEQALAIHTGDAGGNSKRSSRTERALDATSRAMPDALGKMYVDKYFSASAKAKANAILANVVNAFNKRIPTVEWMTPATKAKALSRFRTMYFGVGYPEKWADYSHLNIAADDPVGNLRRVAEWNYERALSRLVRPTDRTEWVLSPHMAAAIYNPLQNAYNFSAALLQPPKFDPSASDATNYGSVGAIFGHELSHFIDPLGAGYDDDGAINPWWSKEDKVQFEAASAALVKQFSDYHPFPGMPIDGKLTLSENVADLGGLAVAFDAYRASLGGRAKDPAYVREQDRQFFLAYARAYRVKANDDAVRAQLASDHAPEKFRAWAVRNFDAWYAAFDVQRSDALFLEPNARVRVW